MRTHISASQACPLRLWLSGEHEGYVTLIWVCIGHTCTIEWDPIQERAEKKIWHDTKITTMVFSPPALFDWEKNNLLGKSSQRHLLDLVWPRLAAMQMKSNGEMSKSISWVEPLPEHPFIRFQRNQSCSFFVWNLLMNIQNYWTNKDQTKDNLQIIEVYRALLKCQDFVMWKNVTKIKSNKMFKTFPRVMCPITYE